MATDGIGNALSRRVISVNGIVQGVGFRPFVYRLATELRLAGLVKNNERGVYIEVEGGHGAVEEFLRRLRADVPPLARITDLSCESIAASGEDGFRIVHSDSSAVAHTLISPDIATCDDCLRELFDPSNRRFHYPFINCTNCGPRYTIVEGIPYDRPLTSMAVFRMCPSCQEEYDDPLDRRFHAEPNACPDCGPRVHLHDGRQAIESSDPISDTVALLRQGRIVAIRGVGGFHLAVDATNDDAVKELRLRKGRAEKPFALMAQNLETVKRLCRVSEDEASALEYRTRPIVLLRALAGTSIAPSVAPGNKYLGVMLPYTPLHHVLLKDRFEALVMTSANLSEEPIVIGNDEARERLSHLTDYYLLHDREILQRCDDSIVRVSCGLRRVIRRARGFVPEPIDVPVEFKAPVLACGAELKNTIALARNQHVFLSQHIGDLENPSAYAFYQHCISHLEQLLEIHPQVLAYDLHPEYLSTKWARQQEDVVRVGVQHHHAHLASVMAENGVTGPTIGLILDGTGYGMDGSIWGGEVLYGNLSGFDRLAWLQTAKMPGGNAAIRQPWRMAVSWLWQAYGDSWSDRRISAIRQLPRDNVKIIGQMLEQDINSPVTSSCGRLFDAVAAMLGVCAEINYEAQAAILLEMTADDGDDTYEVELPRTSSGVIPLEPLIRAVVTDIEQGSLPAAVAGRFHRTLAELFVNVAARVRNEKSCNRVALSGGVYQNRLFFEYMMRRLTEEGFDVLSHSIVPTNDGGIALGQAVIANATLTYQEKDSCVWQYRAS
jgi:hydrogenase maturation protein HypF